jgi:hypothetical protein
MFVHSFSLQLCSNPFPLHPEDDCDNNDNAKDDRKGEGTEAATPAAAKP